MTDSQANNTESGHWPLALVQVSGADAQSFLHRQLTCELLDIVPGASRFGAWCDPRGRVICTLLLSRIADGYSLVLPWDMAELAIPAMSRYILRDQVKFAAPVRQTGTVYQKPDVPPGRAVTLPGEPTRYARFGGGKLAAPANASVWLPEVAAGLPWVLPATSARYLPQMLNLEALGAVSFEKGCYPGQEIIARTHFLGRVKKRLQRAHINASADLTVEPGEPVIDSDGGTVGEVLLSACDQAKRWELLLVLAAVQGELTVCGHELTLSREA